VRPSIDTLRTPWALLPPAWRKAAAGISLLWMATALGAVLTFLVQVLLARRLGPVDFGRFIAALATVTMVAPMAGFGLPQLWLRLYGAEGWQARRWLLPSLRFVVWTTLAACVAAIAWSAAGAPEGTAALVWWLLPAIPCTLVVGLVSSKLRLEEDDRGLAAWQLALPASRIAFVLAVWPWHTFGAVTAAAGFGLVGMAVAVAGMPALAAMRRGEFNLRGHAPREDRAGDHRDASIRAVWRMGWAYGLSALLYPVFFQVGTVMLDRMAGPREAGLFGIGLGVMTAVYLLPATVYQKYLLSRLHRWAVHDPEKFRRVHRHGAWIMLVAGLVCGALVAGLAHLFVQAAFGPAFVGAAAVIVVLSICAPLRFLSVAIASALLDERQARLRVLMMGGSAAAVVLLNLLLIPRYQALGTAFATVGGEVVLLVSSWFAVRRSVPVLSAVRP
jgi:O-antigen/teichoic acid export membrane protein